MQTSSHICLPGRCPSVPDSATAYDVLRAYQYSGVRLSLVDGQLKAKGGKLTPELKRAASKHYKKLVSILGGQAQSADREDKLAAAEAEWFDFATAERGFFIGVSHNSVIEAQWQKYEAVRNQYLLGTGGVTLQDAYQAFNAYAQSTRKNFTSRQLKGKVYEPKLGGGKASQQQIQAAFEQMKAETLENEDTIGRFFLTSSAPQVDVQPDQLERLSIYFQLPAAEYIDSRLNQRR